MGIRTGIKAAAVQLGLSAALSSPCSQEAFSQVALPSPTAPGGRFTPDPIRHLTSTSFFRQAPPREQSSLLHSAHAAFANSPVEKPKSTAALIDQLLVICESPAYARLSERDRQAVVTLAHLEVPGFERVFPTGLSSLEEPSSLGAIARDGGDLLQRVEALSQGFNQRLGCPGALAARQLLTAVLQPNGIRQIGPTCFPTVLVRHLATAQPREFLRMTLDLIERGETETRHGLRLKFDDAWASRSSSALLGFPVGQVLAWPLYQALFEAPVADIEKSNGLGELLTGIEASRFLGSDITFSANSRRADFTLAVGDIVFLTPDAENRGHVFQVARVAPERIALYDPNGPRGMPSMVAARVRALPGEEIESDGALVSITPSLLERIVATRYRLSPAARAAPCFSIERESGQIREFFDRDSLRNFLQDERERFEARTRSGNLPLGLVLSGLLIAVAIRALRSGRSPAPTSEQISSPG